MKKREIVDLIKILISIFTAATFTLITDAVLTNLHVLLNTLAYIGIFVSLFAIYYIIARKKSITFFVTVAVISFLIFAVPYLSWKFFQHNAICSDPDNTKEKLFANQTVMFIVPHEDDELGLGTGLFEQYLKYGSEVYMVYFTNGDKNRDAEIRINGALSAMQQIGIPEDHVIFLGYGDGTLKDMYLCENESKVFTSYSGNNTKYALETHRAFNEGEKYTRKNIIKDIKELLSTYQPDVVFVNDYDMHSDHQAVSLFFDETIGLMLKEGNKNIPGKIYKSFVYSYSIYGYDDFYDSINISATKKTNPEPYITETNVFSWQDRVRFPINADTHSRSIYSSDVYNEALMHVTQGISEQATRMISGDKIFWYRSTDSILYNAEITSSSANAERLNDFKLYDSTKNFDKNEIPNGGFWEAGKKDNEKTIRVILDEKEDINLIRLYDNPSLSSNILEAEIVFDNGHKYNTGALKTNGEYSEIVVDETGVKSFEITVSKSEGEHPGLTEIEAFREAEDTYSNLDFIKVVNSEGNFVYDYIINPKGEEKLSLYTPNKDIKAENFDVTVDGKCCSAKVQDGHITVKCPMGGSCYITVTDGYNSDIVKISNPGWAYRLGWEIDKFYFKSGAIYDNSMLSRTMCKIREVL